MHFLNVLVVLSLASLFFLFVLRFDFALVTFLLNDLATLAAEKIKNYYLKHISIM